jgi:hypothetical protein
MLWETLKFYNNSSFFYSFLIFYIMKQFIKAAGIVVALFLAGCNKDSEDNKVALKSIAVTPSSVTVSVNATVPLEATPVPADASDVKFEWSSADPTVATVSETGLVTGKKAGNTTVKVKSGNIEKTVPVEVTTLPTTGHPDHGKINLSLNWDDRAEDVDIPSSYRVVAGSFSGDATGESFTPDHLFDPGALTVIAYAAADNITISDNTATLVSADGIFSAAPGWFFSGSQSLTVVKDTDHPVAVEMHQQTGLLTVELTSLPAGVTAVNATLSGMATQINLETGATTGDPGTVAPVFTQSEDKYVATVKLLGTVGSSQTLTLTMTGENINREIIHDLSEDLAAFNSNKKTPVLLSLPLVILPETTPFNNQPVLISSSAAAEFFALDFDLGGEGVAYHDATSANEGAQWGGGTYRNAKDPGCGVDHMATGSPDAIGWFQEDEWLIYTVNVQDAGSYQLEINAKVGNQNSRCHIEIDGVNVTETLIVPTNTDGWWTAAQPVNLETGIHQFKFYYEAPCCIFDLNKFRLTYQQ